MSIAASRPPEDLEGGEHESLDGVVVEREDFLHDVSYRLPAAAMSAFMRGSVVVR